MIVADASVVVLGLLADGDSRRVLATEAVAVPHLVDVEVAHALRSQVRRRVVDAHDAARALRAWSRLGVQRVPVVGLLERVWDLRENLSAYDATYVALAEALGVPLVTADGRMASAPGHTCPVTVLTS